MLLFTTNKKEKNNDDVNLTENITDQENVNSSENIENKDESSNVQLADIHFGETYPTKDNHVQHKQDEPDNFFFDMGYVTLLNNTTIYFNCYVEKNTVDDAIRLIKTVNRNIATIELDYPELKGKLPFKFIINSGGGNVVQGLRLFDAIKNNIYPITTIANGIAASMGIILLVAGKTIQATKHSTLMIHQLSAGAQGKYFELQGHMKFWTDLQTLLGTLLVENTKAKKEDIAKFMTGETYMLAEEALKLGIIESIVSV